MRQSKLNHSYIERIIYSKQFRSLQDKTQLFYPSQKQRVRTRLTHTLEVRLIAHKIACLLNEKISEYNLKGTQRGKAEGMEILPADLELVDAIAFAHDIGHTPFGHIGERTIDDVVSGKDSLGGLVYHGGDATMRFKHNSNSLRILNELGVDDWRITEGALSHTRICYKGDNTVYKANPYNPFADLRYTKLVSFILEQNKLNFSKEQKSNPPSLTLEGQIVSVADEIAQRAADLGDAKIKARYVDRIKYMFEKYIEDRGLKYIEEGKFLKATNGTIYSWLEWIIFTTMTEDVAQQTLCELEKQLPNFGSYCGITHAIYPRKIVTFSSDMAYINDTLDSFVTSFLAQSEEVRESDSRSRYIIRQLYKAYLSDITLLPDEVIEKHLTKLTSKDVFKSALRDIGENSECEMRGTFKKILSGKWYVENEIAKVLDKKLLDISTITDYFKTLRNGSENMSEQQNIALLFDAFLLDVGFYIAGMTNTEAFSAYNKIYGHVL